MDDEHSAEESFLLTQAFEAADIDGDGTLTIDEVNLFMGLLGQASSRRGRSLGFFKQSGEDVPEVTKADFIERCDRAACGGRQTVLTLPFVSVPAGVGSSFGRKGATLCADPNLNFPVV